MGTNIFETVQSETILPGFVSLRLKMFHFGFKGAGTTRRRTEREFFSPGDGPGRPPGAEIGKEPVRIRQGRTRTGEGDNDSTRAGWRGKGGGGTGGNGWPGQGRGGTWWSEAVDQEDFHGVHLAHAPVVG